MSSFVRRGPCTVCSQIIDKVYTWCQTSFLDTFGACFFPQNGAKPCSVDDTCLPLPHPQLSAISQSVGAPGDRVQIVSRDHSESFATRSFPDQPRKSLASGANIGSGRSQNSQEPGASRAAVTLTGSRRDADASVLSGRTQSRLPILNTEEDDSALTTTPQAPSSPPTRGRAAHERNRPRNAPAHHTSAHRHAMGGHRAKK